MAHADWIIDLGPGAGHDGGRVVFEGTPADLVAARSTLTGEHLAAYVGISAEALAPHDEAVVAVCSSDRQRLCAANCLPRLRRWSGVGYSRAASAGVPASSGQCAKINRNETGRFRVQNR